MKKTEKIRKVFLANGLALLVIFSYFYLSENEYVAFFALAAYLMFAVLLTHFFGWRQFWLWEFGEKWSRH